MKIMQSPHTMMLAVLATTSMSINAAPNDTPLFSCKTPSQCTGNSIDAHCYEMACKAKIFGCRGNKYSFGDCKDLAELHEKAGCEMAKPGCGSSLPKRPSKPVQIKPNLNQQVK